MRERLSVVVVPVVALVVVPVVVPVTVAAVSRVSIRRRALASLLIGSNELLLLLARLLGFMSALSFMFFSEDRGRRCGREVGMGQGIV